MDSNNFVYGRLTFKYLEEILDLPKNVKIINVHSGAFIHEHNAVHIILSHPSFSEVPDKQPVPRMSWPEIDACRNFQETTSSTPSAS